jgi:hypothetical protein
MSRLRELVKAIRDGDEAMVEEAVLRMSRSRRWLAPLALAVGALEMLFEGVKLVFSNWRLTVVQILPAMWIWLAMLDLKAHVLHGRSFHPLSGPIVIPLVALVAAITAAAFFLNAVFAFAIARPGPPGRASPAPGVICASSWDQVPRSVCSSALRRSSSPAGDARGSACRSAW